MARISTLPWITGRSLLGIDWTIRLPTPGRLKKNSTTTVPPMQPAEVHAGQRHERERRRAQRVAEEDAVVVRPLARAAST